MLTLGILMVLGIAFNKAVQYLRRMDILKLPSTSLLSCSYYIVNDFSGFYVHCFFYFANRKGHLDILKLMLDENKCNLNVINHLGQSLLHVAVMNARTHIVDILLTRGIDPVGFFVLSYCSSFTLVLVPKDSLWKSSWVKRLIMTVAIIVGMHSSKHTIMHVFIINM